MKLSLGPKDDSGCVVSIAGPVTQKTTAMTADALAQIAGSDCYARNMTLDLSEATLLDSSGVNWLLKCHKQAKSSGGKLVLRRPAPIVVNVLKLLKLDSVFEIDTTPGVA
ncbi:MAG: STAS domain-containing protein [Pirellulaceae bacterium]|nr:STAS domain-containing protein [Pirellulaceae bacterium]